MIHRDEEQDGELEDEDEDDDRDEGEKEEIRPVRKMKVTKRESVVEKNLSVESMAQRLQGEGEYKQFFIFPPSLFVMCTFRHHDSLIYTGVFHS